MSASEAYVWNRFTSVTPAEIREARVSALRSDDKGEESLVSVLDLIDDVVFSAEATDLENVKETVKGLRDELDELRDEKRDEKREIEDERDALLTERDELASRLAKAEEDVLEAVIAERDKALADVKTLESAIQRTVRDYDLVFGDARLEVRRVGNKMLVSLPEGLGEARTLVVPVFTDRNAVHFTSRGK